MRMKHVGNTPQERLLSAAKLVRDDLLMRAKVDGDDKVVNLSNSVWCILNECIAECEG